MFVIITVPHSQGLDSNVRTHDTNALSMAKILKRIFSLHNIECVIIQSHQNRQYLDDNRYHSQNKRYTIKKDSELWDNVRSIIKTFGKYVENKGAYINLKMMYQSNISNKSNYTSFVIIDSHSFPRGSFKDKNKNDIVILDYTPYQKITKDIIDSLNSQNVKASLLEGMIGSNSILDIFTLHPMYIPTILLETCEDIEGEKLGYIADIIVKSIIYTMNDKN